MNKRDAGMTVEQKALAINLDKHVYGTIVEIGAGQEVARQFFKVGAAAGTVAKTMSAYDMQVSDAIYGQSGRYVSKDRLMQMLEIEFQLIIDRLAEVRPKNSTFFAYAATVAARSYKSDNECHGWVGLRLQLYPGAPPSDVILHVRMLDVDNRSQSEALGVLGVNLIHGAFQHCNQPRWIIDGLQDGLGSDRIEVDFIHFTGPYFEDVENRLLNLHLIRAWLTRAVIFSPSGEVMVPGELFYRKNVLSIRGTFNPVTKVNVDMIEYGMQQFSKLHGVDAAEAVTLAEITMNTLVAGDEINDEEFLARVDLLSALGYTVMISDYVRFFRLRAYLRRYTRKQIAIVLSVLDFAALFEEKYYDGLEGGILEAFGKLFPDNTHVYVYPGRIDAGGGDGETPITTLANVDVPAHLRHLLAHLIENGKLIAFDQYDEKHLHIDSRAVLRALRDGGDGWQQWLPERTAEQIVERGLLGYDRRR